MLTTYWLGFDGSPLTFDFAGSLIGLDPHDQNIPGRLGFLQEIHVLSVKEIKEASGENESFTLSVELDANGGNSFDSVKHEDIIPLGRDPWGGRRQN